MLDIVTFYGIFKHIQSVKNRDTIHLKFVTPYG